MPWFEKTLQRRLDTLQLPKAQIIPLNNTERLEAVIRLKLNVATVCRRFAKLRLFMDLLMTVGFSVSWLTFLTVMNFGGDPWWLLWSLTGATFFSIGFVWGYTDFGWEEFKTAKQLTQQARELRGNESA
ncbi:hypothetical protein [Stenoxybacter acetivorans]|uniref:hypothetical protein n=1 Tax=Stenoxybacter acetivorans TaxID=422441 RepID=UPI0005638352|nr:hypothetical protein [Stenoxybacter acetivorans]